jgi:hypothetical protein
MVDRVNAIQRMDSAGRTPEELPWLLRAIPVPMSEPVGRVTPIGYLTDTIYGRDLWMHWLDICRATGREMVITPEYDGRVKPEVMLADGRIVVSGDRALAERVLAVTLVAY